MSEIRVDSIGNETNTGGPVLSGITTFSGQQYFIPPKGTTAERPSDCPPGSIRFNTDTTHLEYWQGTVWLEFEASSEELGDNNQTASPGGTGTRGVFMRGQTPASETEIDYVTVETLGAPVKFGDLSATNGGGNAPFSSRTRGIFHGGTPADADIEFITISSTGTVTDWGANLGRSVLYGMGAANQTRGLSAGAFSGDTDRVDYVTIASAGTVVQFGDLITGASHGASVQSSTRAVFMGGYVTPGSTRTGMLQTFQFASTGNAQDFGDLSSGASNNHGGVCNSTRGVCALGNVGSTYVNTIEYITLATYGNSIDFGDSVTSNTHRGGGCCSPTRGIFMGGWTGSTDTTEMEFITIPTTGNATDFGDLIEPTINVYGCSNGHGGL
jgi:hypothetical protein